MSAGPSSSGSSTLHDDRPVLVAGGGPVGLVTALLLARHGVPTVVLEARPRRETVGSKAICMQRDVLDLLDRVGVADAMVAEGVTWTRGVTYYRGRELFTITFPEVGASRFPPFVNLSQSRTEELLLERVRREPGIELRYDSQILAVSQNGDGVTVSVTAADGTSALSGSHLVAADGGHSAVRRLLGIPFEGHTYDDQFVIADIRAELPFAAERRFFFDPEWNPGRQVLLHPQPDSVWRIDWQVPGVVDLEAERASGALHERIRRVVGDVDYELVWVSAYRFSSRVARRFVVDRVLLAGDAAHLMSPFGARGLNSGVHDAENAAWKLAFIRHGWAGKELLSSYEVERRAAAEENLRVTGATMRFLVPQTEEEWSRRRAVLERALTDASARTLVDSGKLAEPYWYLDSSLTTPSEGRTGFPTAPGVPRPPIAGVLCPDGPCRVPGRPTVTRLRQLFGDGFVLLTSGTGHTDLPRAVAGGLPAGLPVATYDLDELDVEGVLRPGLRAEAGRVHVVRPDGYLAAVLPTPDPAALAAALRRAVVVPEPPATRPGGAPVDAAAELARQCAAAMYAQDRASRHLGIEVSDVAPGRATARMVVTEAMVNGHGICHGGYLFLLADSAFAFACNPYGAVTVAAAAEIVFVAPGQLGDELTAEARERVRYGRSGLYDVTVRSAVGSVLAEFRGTSRALRARLLPSNAAGTMAGPTTGTTTAAVAPEEGPDDA